MWDDPLWGKSSGQQGSEHVLLAFSSPARVGLYNSTLTRSPCLAGNLSGTLVLGHMQRYEAYSMLLLINYKIGPGHYSKQLIRLLQ